MKTLLSATAFVALAAIATMAGTAFANSENEQQRMEEKYGAKDFETDPNYDIRRIWRAIKDREDRDRDRRNGASKESTDSRGVFW